MKAVNTLRSVGAFGWAYVPSDFDTLTDDVSAVRGRISDNTGPNQPNVWAGLFGYKVNIVGDAYINGTHYTSDQELKTNVEDLGNAMEGILALQPKTYNFRASEYPWLNLDEDRHMGLMAQDVAEVYPDLVKRRSLSAEFDEEGNMTHPAHEHLTLNYTELIPLLIAGMQEQNARIASLEELLSACCANPDGGVRSAPMTPEGTGPDSGDRRLHIQPNPFNEATTVSYTLERAGRMQLLANSADGKQLQVLQEGQRPAGDHRFEWNTSGLEAGMYYVTLLLDGQPVVKKAVKVAR